MPQVRYHARLDRQTRHFIEETDRLYPPDAAGMSIAGQRRVYDTMARAFLADYPAGVTVRDIRLPGADCAVPARLYEGEEKTRATIVYCHGGGFVVGGLDSHDDICAELCMRTGCRVVAVDYRLSPEARHPAAFDDARTALAWALAEYGSPVLVCGDSAGGNLAAAVCHASRAAPRRPAGQVLIYPGLGGDRTVGSYIEHAEAPMLGIADVVFYETIRTNGVAVEGDATLAPLHDTDFSGLPPTVVFSAECDPLASDGAVYRDRIATAGGKAKWFEETGLVHGYLRGRHTVDRARESFSRIVAALNALADRTWPYD